MKTQAKNIWSLPKRLVSLGLAAGCLTALFVACAGSGVTEGDRCNPALSHNECDDGLSCVTPTDCAESYCCPTSGTSSQPNCNPGCNGGAATILEAQILPTCTSSSPSPLCACITFAGVNITGVVPDGGPGCDCFAQPDPIACLATEAQAEAGTPAPAAEGGADGGSD